MGEWLFFLCFLCLCLCICLFLFSASLSFYGAGVFGFRFVYESVGQKNKHACWVLEICLVLKLVGFFP